MKTKIHSIVATLIILLGIVHIFFVFPIQEFNTDALYFIGSGGAIIFAGFLNLIAIKTATVLIRRLAILANFLMLLLFSIAIFTLHEPQVYFAVVLFTTSLFLCLNKVTIDRK